MCFLLLGNIKKILTKTHLSQYSLTYTDLYDQGFKKGDQEETKISLI